ncbi:hypothetical protein [Roseateles violae]|uniref:Lipoprotein n=1 Tax=Roseateles violae TaxID=3058042 RepID=A0ABT8DUD0_9BURK|nr:hypothetical protein [Pelomonas sp. PFR6]MDN3921894.1 hypothetical protein [Pelomonas sp. PFR6]
MPAARLRCSAILLLAAALAGCASIQPARMALPEGLAAGSDQLQVHGVGGGTRGQISVEGRELRYERSASRLSLFDDLYSSERSALAFSWGADTASCKLRQRDSQINVVAIPLKPWTLNCGLPGGATLTVVEASKGPRTLQRERRGELRQGEQRWTLRSVHKLEGSDWPVAEPIGYVLEDQGRAVAAVETNGGDLRLFLPRDTAARAAAAPALLAVALLWSPQ